MNEPRNEKGQTLTEFLAEYDITKYPRPSVTVDNIVIARVDERPAVLLIRRRNHPFIGCLALPGGFVEPDEELTDAAKRELFEETGVTDVRPHQLGAYGRPGRDPRGWIITVAFMMHLPYGQLPTAGDDASDAGLYYIDVDTENGFITLTRTDMSESIELLYEVENGRAKFIPNRYIAGDHAQILTDALIAMGMV